jgi:hypothetical protein
MGLFRRGTKLLRLGGGLRDCCCRPEKPEECWCPDICRYYFDFGGTPRLSARDIPESPTCVHGSQFSIERNLESYGLATIQPSQAHGVSFWSDGKYLNLEGTGVVGSPTGECYYLLFSYDSGISGYTPQSEFTDQFDPQFAFSQQMFYQTFLQIAAYPGPSFFYPDQPPSTWGVVVGLLQEVLLIKYGFGSLATTLYKRSVFSRVPVPASCIADSRYECVEDVAPRRLHTVSLDAELTIDPQNGVVFDGEIYGWQEAGAFPPDVDLGYTEWHVEGEYPLSQNITVSLKSRPSCVSSPCDCDLDLTGRTVVFEGQTFTYGSLQQFISDDGLTIWEEGQSAGRFTREDRRECDGTVTMRTRTADVSCSTFDGVPRWFVYLDSDCYERENGGCDPTVTASKITLYNGAFSCDSDGYPLGAAHSFTEDTDPPDLDQENISGTPSANCDVENPIPSISFS